MKRLIFLNDINNREAFGSASSNPTLTFFINNNGSTSYFLDFIRTNTNSESGNIGWSRPNQAINRYKSNIQDFICNGISQGLGGVIVFTYNTTQERDEILSVFSDRQFSLTFGGLANGLQYPFVKWKYKGNDISISDNFLPFECLVLYPFERVIDDDVLSEFNLHVSDLCSNLSGFNFTQSCASGFCFSFDEDVPTDCIDSRTSEDGQNLHFIISDGESNITELDVPFLLSEGSTQEKAIKTYMNDTLYNSLINLYNLNHNVMARCYFNAGVVRSACTVRLVGKVYGQSVAIKPSTTVPYVGFDYDVVGGTDVDILKANFEPCSDKPISISEDLRAFLQGLNVQSDLSLGFNLYQVLPYKVVIENCTSVTDFCCDDSTPSDNDSITIEPTDGLIKIYGGTQGGSSGGDDVNIQCICDNLSNINNTLLAFKESNQASLEAISSTLSELDFNVDNTCVCDNLQTVSDSIIAVKDSIDNKELSVVNNNTVQPPVNNVTVQPPVNNVTVQSPVNNISFPDTQIENIANNTRSLNNIFDELYNMNVVQSNIEGYFSNIRDSLECDKKGIACVLAEKTMAVDVDLDNTQVSNGLQDISDKLSTLNDNVHDSMFNSDDESNLENINKSLNTSDDESKNIADVIKDKEMGSNIDVEVSPADDVNINRVYYTNQRNGDTNI